MGLTQRGTRHFLLMRTSPGSSLFTPNRRAAIDGRLVLIHGPYSMLGPVEVWELSLAIGRLDLAALLVGTGGAVAVITLGVWTVHHPDKNAPASMCFFLAAVLLAATGDIRMLARGGILRGRPRSPRSTTYGACASNSSLLQAPSSSATNRSFPLSCAAPSF